jgi:hypothetical protein
LNALVEGRIAHDDFCVRKRGLAGAMAKIENYPSLSVLLPEIPAEDLDPPSSCPSPEEGHRLMRYFMKIREAALREAVIELVTSLSSRDDNRR